VLGFKWISYVNAMRRRGLGNGICMKLAGLAGWALEGRGKRGLVGMVELWSSGMLSEVSITRFVSSLVHVK